MSAFSDVTKPKLYGKTQHVYPLEEFGNDWDDDIGTTINKLLEDICREENALANNKMKDNENTSDNEEARDISKVIRVDPRHDYVEKPDEEKTICENDTTLEPTVSSTSQIEVNEKSKKSVNKSSETCLNSSREKEKDIEIKNASGETKYGLSEPRSCRDRHNINESDTSHDVSYKKSINEHELFSSGGNIYTDNFKVDISDDVHKINVKNEANEIDADLDGNIENCSTQEIDYGLNVENESKIGSDNVPMDSCVNGVEETRENQSRTNVENSDDAYDEDFCSDASSMEQRKNTDIVEAEITQVYTTHAGHHDEVDQINTETRIHKYCVNVENLKYAKGIVMEHLRAITSELNLQYGSSVSQEFDLFVNGIERFNEVIAKTADALKYCEDLMNETSDHVASIRKLTDDIRRSICDKLTKAELFEFIPPDGESEELIARELSLRSEIAAARERVANSALKVAQTAKMAADVRYNSTNAELCAVNARHDVETSRTVLESSAALAANISTASSEDNSACFDMKQKKDGFDDDEEKLSQNNVVLKDEPMLYSTRKSENDKTSENVVSLSNKDNALNDNITAPDELTTKPKTKHQSNNSDDVSAIESSISTSSDSTCYVTVNKTVTCDKNYLGRDESDNKKDGVIEPGVRDKKRKSSNGALARHIYSIDEVDFEVQGVGCILRPCLRDFDRDSVDVTCVGLSDYNEVTLDNNEELISNIISVSLTSGTHLMDETVSICLPHVASRSSTFREPIIKLIQPNGKCLELATNDVFFEDIKELRFVETRTRQLGVFYVVYRCRKEALTFKPEGCRVSSCVDSRVSLSCWPRSFRIALQFMLQVHPVDSQCLQTLRALYPTELANFVSCSPITRLVIGCQRFKQPITVTVPIISPHNSSKHRKRPSTSGLSRETEDRRIVGSKRPLTAAGSKETDESSKEYLWVMKKDTNGHWSVASDVTPTRVKNSDMVVFGTTEALERFLVIRTSKSVVPTSLEHCAAIVDASLNLRSVEIILRQKTSQTSCITVVCTTTNKSSQALRRLEDDGFVDGPDICRNVLLKEGQEIEICFRGNITGANHGTPLKACFKSNTPTRLNFDVHEIDTFAQKSIDMYRGFVQILTRDKHVTHRQGQSCKHQETQLNDYIVLAEMLVHLPKPKPESPKPLITAPVVLKESGALDEDVLKYISHHLGDEWLRLAKLLSVRRMRIQAILRQNYSNESHHSIYDMLITWTKSVPCYANKIEILTKALLTCGRQDLAHEINKRNELYMQQRQNAAQDAVLRRAFVRVAQDTYACKNWQSIGKSLGLTPDDISNIDDRIENVHEKCFETLKHWKNMAGDNASVSVLSSHLKNCCHRRLARRVSDHRHFVPIGTQRI